MSGQAFYCFRQTIVLGGGEKVHKHSMEAWEAISSLATFSLALTVATQ